MNHSPSIELQLFEVRFDSLFKQGRGFAFPCNGRGLVDLDILTERARTNYFYARAMVGRETALPHVCPLAVAQAHAYH